MKENRFDDFLTNNGKFSKTHPEYRRVFLLNALLIIMTSVSALFCVFNIIMPCYQWVIYIDGIAALLGILTLLYFHKTDNINISINITLGIFILLLIMFFNIAQNTNYGFYWLVTLPPVAYFLLGTKKALYIIGLFFAYMGYFILVNHASWQPVEFNLESFLNITGALFALIMIISYFERSRQEVSDALIEANTALEERKSELRLILDTTAEGIYGVDIDGKCTFCNDSCVELLGYKDDKDLVGTDMNLLIYQVNEDGLEIPILESKINEAIMSESKIHSKDDVFKRANGTFFDVEYFVYPKYKDDKIVGAVITFMDIRERKKNEAKIKYLSYHDYLTGLINRQSFEMEIKNYDREDFLPLAIVYGDLNGLKLTNDIFGHSAGDKLIKEAAYVLRSVSRRNDVVARIGGDEFVWILPNTDDSSVKKVIERVKIQLSQGESSVIKCSMSMGYYLKKDMSEDIEQVLKNAENSMYRAKSSQKKSNEITMLTELMSSLNERSNYEKQHSENIRFLCEKMGIALGWPESDIKNIAEAGYYHDIGKIVLSKELLNKTSMLTPEEKLEKHQHPAIGYRILNLFDNTLDLAEAVYYHHENWNGLGYPKGLKGEEVPIYSRIIAIVEHYDHLRNRIIATPLDKDEALQRIQQLSGIKFDPKLTDKFVDVMKNLQS